MEIGKNIKKLGFYIVVAVFWLGVAATLIGGCGGLIHSINEDQEPTTEDIILDKVP